MKKGTVNQIAKGLSSLVLILGGLFLLGTNSALAVGAAYFPQDTSLVLAGVSATMTIVGGSNADQISTTDTTFSIIISPGESFTVSSPNQIIFSNDGGYSTGCFSGSSSLVIQPLPGSAQATVNVTPSSTTCPSSSGGGAIVFNAAAVTSPIPVSSTPAPSPIAQTSPLPTLVSLFRKANDPKIYWQDQNGFLHGIKTINEFNAAGYRFENVKVISGREFVKMRIAGRLKVASGFKYLNVRTSASAKAKAVSRILPGDEFEFIDVSNGWYKIKKDGKEFGWVFGKFVKEI